VTKLLIFSVTT